MRLASYLPHRASCWRRLTLLVLVSVPGRVFGQAPKPSELQAQTASTSTSASDLELARYLTVLENLEMLEDLELLQVMPFLEEEDD